MPQGSGSGSLGRFVTKAWERDWKIRQIESDVKDERVVYVKKEQKREFVW